MIGAVPWSPAWQALLDGLGWVLAEIYDLIPNYGVSIIVLTVLIRVVLLPLGVKQIRSMQHMQLVQPKIKGIQQRYKGNKQKQQEEIMRVYKEHGVSPLSGCWPVLLQLPIFISMYSVLRFPQHPIHLPEESQLRAAVTRQVPNIESMDQIDQIPEQAQPSSGTDFLWMNLLCAPSQAGNPDAEVGDAVPDGDERVQVSYPVNCGQAWPVRIPYYIAAALMFGTTYFQQRQMQKASPPGAASQQQQALLRVMPLVFGVFGIFFPVALVLYWSTSNLWQIGQQYFMVRTRPSVEDLAARADGKKPRRGLLASLMERADTERQRRAGQSGAKPGGSSKPGSPKQPPKKPGPGGNGGRGRKKRPKR